MYGFWPGNSEEHEILKSIRLRKVMLVCPESITIRMIRNKSILDTGSSLLTTELLTLNNTRVMMRLTWLFDKYLKIDCP